jgi:hypothetical protein
VFALIVGLAAMFSFSLEESPADISVVADPRTSFIRDRATSLISSLGFSVLTCVVFSLAVPEIFGFANGIASGYPLGFRGMLANGLAEARNYTEPSNELLKLRIAIALALGISGWFVFGLSASKSVWPRWLITRSWLTIRGQLPWRFFGFLSDAHKRGVLRQQGAV